jgi:hypothetical protein
MSWREAQLLTQIEAEVSVGAPHRLEILRAKAEEDAAAAGAAAAMERMEH